jgi:hypothetical protein
MFRETAKVWNGRTPANVSIIELGDWPLTIESRRKWSRVAGLMYLLVLFADLLGMQMPHSSVGRSLTLIGSLLTVPLAVGLYFTLKVFQPITSAVAMACRLIEAAVGIIATVAGFEAVRASLGASIMGRATLHLIAWNKATSFGALVFTLGSTLFFVVFLRSGSIPRILSCLGLFASLLAFAACFAHLIWQSFSAMSMPAWIPMLIAEIATGGWLLIRAVKTAPSPATL